MATPEIPAPSDDKTTQRVEAAEIHIDHEFKSHPDVFFPAACGEKTFEFRKDDRGGFHVGQTVRLRCYHPILEYLDVSPLDRWITNILRGGEFGLQDGYCILSLAPLVSPPRVEAAETERELAALIARYYESQIGVLMHQAEHWIANGKPLGVQHRVLKADAYYQIQSLMQQMASSGFENPFVMMRDELSRPPVYPAGSYPPAHEVHRYRDCRFVVQELGRLASEKKGTAPVPAQVVGDGWSPAETAPKDGLPLDLWGHWPESGNWERSADAVWLGDEWHVRSFGELFPVSSFKHGPRFTHWRRDAGPAALTTSAPVEAGGGEALMETGAMSIGAANIADALDCFWNAALGSEREGGSTVQAIVQGVAAVSNRLRELAAPRTAPAVGVEKPELERVRHVNHGTEHEVLGEAEAMISPQKAESDRFGYWRGLYAGDKLTVYRCIRTRQIWCQFTDEFRDGRFVPAAPKSVPAEGASEDRKVANLMEAFWLDAEDEVAKLASGLRPSDEEIAEVFHEHRREHEPGLPPWSEVQSDSGIWRYSHNFAARLSSLPVSTPALARDVCGALAEIAAERRRQIEVEGWTPKHDDLHAYGEMGHAAACYAAGGPVYVPAPDGSDQYVPLWPWSPDSLKLTDRRRNLIKSAALSVAEIERLDRGAVKEVPFAYCCNMNPTTCDCVNPNHGTAWIATPAHHTDDEGAQS